MTCTLVSQSSAPVGSSASRMSGLLTSARAMATRCIWPPDISVGVLVQLVAQTHLFEGFHAPGGARSAPETPEMVSASSTLVQHRLVRDQVIALEHETDGVVAVGSPSRASRVLPWWRCR